MGGDRAPDLVCRQRRPLLVGFGQNDRKVRRPVCVQESNRVGVADRLAEPLRQLAQQALDLDRLELLVDVLGVVQLDRQHRQRPVVADGAIGLLADQGVDELRVPDPGHRVDHPEKGARGPVGLAVAAARAVLRGLRHLGAAIPAGRHGRQL